MSLIRQLCPEAEEFMQELDENKYEEEIRKPRGGKKPFRESMEEIVVEETTEDGKKKSSTTDKSNFVTDFQDYKSYRRNI